MSAARRTRPGFTLLEVVIALLLTAIAVTIAASALRAATTARDRVVAHQQSAERDVRLRAQLTDMLRHAPAADAVDEPFLRVTRDASGAGTLVFLSTGVRAPYGTGATWRVAVTGSDSGVVLDATPIGVTSDATRLRSELHDARDFAVQLLEHGSPRTATVGGASGTVGGTRWRTDWPLERSRPAMIALRWTTNGGADTSLLVVPLDPLQTDGGRR